ncbi:MAG: MerR family transcriptional regulator [Candidatus Lernaella stagnicola]|nr:MerR family transcriptional regulator [Candidatus Lernaella stagnicola]
MAVDESREIPKKLYFKIGEVSEITGVKPYVLRYWETEFNIVRPSKTRTNQRLYRRKEVELILEIKRLLYEEKFTIAGAKKVLMERSRKRADKGHQQLTMSFNREEYVEILKKIKRDILEIKKSVESYL